MKWSEAVAASSRTRLTWIVGLTSTLVLSLALSCVVVVSLRTLALLQDGVDERTTVPQYSRRNPAVCPMVSGGCIDGILAAQQAFA